jgi:hypothetical protein
MAIIVSQKSNSDFPIIEAGPYAGRCYMVVDIGTHDAEYKGKKYKRRIVQIGWEFPEEQRDFGKGKMEPVVVSQKYTLTFGTQSKPSKLRTDLQSWRGRPFTQEELDKFKLDEHIVGVPATVTISHVEKFDKSGMLAVVSGLGKIMKGITCPPAILKPLIYEINQGVGGQFNELPKWMQDAIRNSDEWKGAISGATDQSEPAPNPDDAAPTCEDDVPF